MTFGIIYSNTNMVLVYAKTLWQYLVAIIYKDEEKIKSGHDRSRHVQIVLQEKDISINPKPTPKDLFHLKVTSVTN